MTNQTLSMRRTGRSLVRPQSARNGPDRGIRIRMAAPIACNCLAALFQVACSESVGPIARGQTALVLGGETTSVRTIDVKRGVVTARLSSAPRYIDSYALSGDNRSLYLIGFGSSQQPRALFGIDVASLSLRYMEPLTAIASQVTTGQAALYGARALSVAPDGRAVALDGMLDGVPGLWTVDLGTLVPKRFWGPATIAAAAVAPLPPSTRYPGGGLAVIGSRPDGSASPRRFLFVLDPESLLAEDSIPVPDFTRQLLALSAGEQLLYVSPDSVFWYDVQSARVVASVVRAEPFGRISCAPAGDICYESDPGDGRDWPGSGRVYRLDRALGLRSPFELGGGEPGPSTPTVNHVATSRDGTAIYVVSGTASIGPLFGPQPGTLFVVDRTTGAVRKRLPTGDWHAWAVLAF